MAGRHEERCIGERKINSADFDRHNLLDQELMSRIVRHRLFSLFGPQNAGSLHWTGTGPYFLSPLSSRGWATTPAERSTFRTPAQNPRSRRTIIPQGAVPTKRSKT